MSVTIFDLVPNPLILDNHSQEDQVKFWSILSRMKRSQYSSKKELLEALSEYGPRGRARLYLIYEDLHKALRRAHNLENSDYMDQIIHYSVMGGLVQFTQCYNHLESLANSTRILDTVIRLN